MKTEKQDNRLVVRISKKDMLDPISVHAEFEKLIVDENYRRIAIDLSEVTEMHSLQLGCLVGLHLLAYENAALLAFENVAPKIRMLFKLIGIETLLEYHSDPGLPKPE